MVGFEAGGAAAALNEDGRGITMVDSEFLRLLLLIGQWVIVPVIGWMGMNVRGIYHELRSLNGRLTKLEQELKGHITLDDSRFNDLRDLVKEAITSLRALHAP